MQRQIPAFLMMLSLALTTGLFASGKKDANVSVTFHSETEASGNPKMIYPQMVNGKTRYFNRIPDIATKDIASFTPFPSDAGENDYGVIFRLKDTAAKRYSALTSMNQNHWILSQVNGRVVDAFLVDKQVEDGRIVIWKGVSLADVTLLDANLPRTGQEGAKKKK
jgi:hypothetical protein